jgi:23S rRNA pseudouridine955/2504/2580 synthase/23S rRNA pseudouridine1911/1915/1917 synthase
MSIEASPSKPAILPQIMFEDSEIVVLNKAAGLLVLPDRYDPAIPNLYGLLKNKYGQIYVVHRIDKETSGLIIFAKNETSHRILNEQFENRETEKTYRAICVGEPLQDEGRIDLALAEDGGKKGRMRIDQADGKNAVTNYRVMERFEGFSSIEAKPETGRTHQIRVHLKAINLPILGDSVYGGGQGFFLSQIKPGYRLNGEEKPLLSRTALHAARLSVLHPGTHQPVTFETDLPKDMKIVLNYLRKFRRM